MNNLVQNLKVFENEEFGQVRATTIKNEPWFVGKDIATVLGYRDVSSAILSHVDEEDRVNSKTQGCFAVELGQRGSWLINESGLYSLILSSKLPNAKKFKRWVTSEVLPSIRKTGGYIPVAEDEDDATIMAKALLVAQKTIDNKNKELEVKTKELEDKNRFINQIAASKNSLLVREVAKIISKSDSKILIGERRLYEKLREWGWVHNKGTEPKQYALDRGYLEVQEGMITNQSGTFTYYTTKVTGKGQKRILEKLLKEQSKKINN
nr:MAG TPA: repressor domain protein [Caudoviricetes sp.]